MRFLFNGGDGDQSYFSHRFVAERVFEAWFPNSVPTGPAYLLKALDGPYAENYFAISSRMVASLEEQESVRDYLSVIVYTVAKPNEGKLYSEDNLNGIGMAAVKILCNSGDAIPS